MSGIPRHRVEKRFSGAVIAVFPYVFIFDISYISFSVISALFHFLYLLYPILCDFMLCLLGCHTLRFFLV